ncbi:MAG: PfkB family carbohydrate kinase [Planctomycetaceae bacterium]
MLVESAGSVTVFCPTPLLTVTIENQSSGDSELHLHGGGQGYWVARMIANLNVPVTLVTPLGGDPGRLLKVLLTEEGLKLQSIDTSGANGSYVHDRRTGERVEICRIAGSKLTRHEVDDLYNATLTAALGSQLLVLTGQYPAPVLPAAVFQRLARDLQANGRRVIADLSGDDLCEALGGGVELLCFSHEELVSHGYAASDALPDLIAGLAILRERGARQIVLHRGAEPTIAWLDDGMWEVITPRVTPADHRGGGDTFLAALAAGMVRKKQVSESLRFAAAAGTLNVTRHGLGSGRLEHIVELSRHVEIRPLGV